MVFIGWLVVFRMGFQVILLILVSVTIFLEFFLHVIVVVHELTSVVLDRGGYNIRNGKETHTLFSFEVIIIDIG